MKNEYLFEYKSQKLDILITGASFPFLSTTVVLLSLGKRKILIDTGYPNVQEKLIANLKSRGILPHEITDLILTHYHLDHLGNAGLFPKARIYLGQEDYHLLVQIHNKVEKDEELFFLTTDTIGISDQRKVRAVISILKNSAGLIETLVNHNRLNLIEKSLTFDEKVEIKKTPGHTDGHISIFCDFGAGKDVCIAGDALPTFSVANCGVPLQEGVINQNDALFLKSKEEIKRSAIIIPGHDEPFSVDGTITNYYRKGRSL